MKVKVTKEELEKVVGHSDFGGALTSFLIEAELIETEPCNDCKTQGPYGYKENTPAHCACPCHKTLAPLPEPLNRNDISYYKEPILELTNTLNAVIAFLKDREG